MHWKDRFIRIATQDWSEIATALMAIDFNYREYMEESEEYEDRRNFAFAKLDQSLEYVRGYFLDHNEINPSFFELSKTPNWSKIIAGYRIAIKIFNDHDFGYYNPTVANKMHRGLIRMEL